jgi:hypothetical protein
MLTSLATKRTA